MSRLDEPRIGQVRSWEGVHRFIITGIQVSQSGGCAVDAMFVCPCCLGLDNCWTWEGIRSMTTLELDAG